MNRIIYYKIQIKKILGLIITCACLISCEMAFVEKSYQGKIVEIKKNIFSANDIVFKTDDGYYFSTASNDEAMDEYYFLNKVHVKIRLSVDKSTQFITNEGIQPIN